MDEQYNVPMKDSRGNEAGSTGWREINDTWLYVGNVGELYMYQKLVGKYIVPDVVGLRSYKPALNLADYKKMVLAV